jgi:hypothetical protein
MFPGHIHRGKVYWYFGHIFQDGTCIDGFDVILPGDRGYAEKRDFIVAWNRDGLSGWTRPKLFIEAWERDEDEECEVRDYLESL